MQARYLRDSSPTGRTCPTLYSSDRGTFLVQGKKVGDAVRRSLSGLGGQEEVVEVPAMLLAEIAEDTVFPADGGQGVTTVLIRAVPRDMSSPSLSATSRGTFLVRGVRVTDREALAAMDVPGDETVVEVPRELLLGIRADAA
jgi:hypothetical protein